MPKLTHEAVVELVRTAPGLIPGLLRAGRPGEPPRPVRITAAEYADTNLAEHRADVVLALGGTATRPDEALIVEIQLEVDPRKRLSWPIYVAGPRSRLGCPVTLVIVTLDRDVARWCAEPIDLGRGRCVLLPWVIGPDDIPFVTDVDQALADPELAVLSLAAHGHEPGAEHIALAALTALQSLDSDRPILYPDVALAMLGKVARAALEQLMNFHGFDYRTELARICIERFTEAGVAAGMTEEDARERALGRLEGEALGRSKTLLTLLKLRGFTVPAPVEQRVMACDDLDLLNTWIARVLTATDLDELLAP